MNKKRIIFFMLLIFTFTLTACKDNNDDTVDTIESLEIDSAILSKNIYSYNNDEFKEINFNKYNIDFTSIVSQNLNYGCITVDNEYGHYGVWSLIKNQLIIPYAAGNSITYIYDVYFGAFIRVANINTETEAYYDMFGNQILQADSYYDVEIYGTHVAEYDEFFYEELSREYFINVSYLTTEDYIHDVETYTRKKYSVNIETQVLTEVLNDNYAYGEQYDEENEYYQDLSIYGLPGYYLDSDISLVTVYNSETNEKIASYTIPQSNEIENITLMNGHIFYQISYQVNNLDTEYTYQINGLKYILKTVSIDLLTGESTILDVNYKIDSIDYFKNTDGIIEYSIIEATPIESKVLAFEVSHQYVINSSGEIVANVDGIDFENLEILDETYIIDYNNDAITDYNLNVLVQLPYAYSVVSEAKVVVLQDNGYYGAIDFTGKVVIPFEYKSLSTNFYDGATYGINKDDEFVIVNITNEKTVIENISSYLYDNVIFNYNSTKNLQNLYTSYIYNYQGNPVTIFDVSSPISTSYQVYSVYGDYKIVRYDSYGEYIYIVINTN